MQVGRGGDEISFTNMGIVAETVLAQGVSACANTVSATIPIFVNEISSPPSHLHLDQTDNFPQMLYSNLKLAELGRNM